MKDNNFVDTYKKDFLGHWAKISDVKKPIIAAVNGYAVSIFFLIYFLCGDIFDIIKLTYDFIIFFYLAWWRL